METIYKSKIAGGPYIKQKIAIPNNFHLKPLNWEYHESQKIQNSEDEKWKNLIKHREFATNEIERILQNKIGNINNYVI